MIVLSVHVDNGEGTVSGQSVTRSDQGLKKDDLNVMNEILQRWEGLEEEEMDSKSTSLLACFKLN